MNFWHATAEAFRPSRASSMASLKMEAMPTASSLVQDRSIFSKHPLATCSPAFPRPVHSRRLLLLAAPPEPPPK